MLCIIMLSYCYVVSYCIILLYCYVLLPSFLPSLVFSLLSFFLVSPPLPLPSLPLFLRFFPVHYSLPPTIIAITIPITMITTACHVSSISLSPFRLVSAPPPPYRHQPDRHRKAEQYRTECYHFPSIIVYANVYFRKRLAHLFYSSGWASMTVNVGCFASCIRRNSSSAALIGSPSVRSIRITGFPGPYSIVGVIAIIIPFAEPWRLATSNASRKLFCISSGVKAPTMASSIACDISLRFRPPLILWPGSNRPLSSLSAITLPIISRYCVPLHYFSSLFALSSSSSSSVSLIIA